MESRKHAEPVRPTGEAEVLSLAEQMRRLVELAKPDEELFCLLAPTLGEAKVEALRAQARENYEGMVKALRGLEELEEDSCESG